MTVVAALQHYHGGWNDMMKAVSVMPECFLSIIKEKSKIELFGELLIYIFFKKEATDYLFFSTCCLSINTQMDYLYVCTKSASFFFVPTFAYKLS